MPPAKLLGPLNCSVQCGQGAKMKQQLGSERSQPFSQGHCMGWKSLLHKESSQQLGKSGNAGSLYRPLPYHCAAVFSQCWDLLSVCSLLVPGKHLALLRDSLLLQGPSRSPSLIAVPHLRPSPLSLVPIPPCCIPTPQECRGKGGRRASSASPHTIGVVTP